jgi:hypothetical protein
MDSAAILEETTPCCHLEAAVFPFCTCFLSVLWCIEAKGVCWGTHCGAVGSSESSEAAIHRWRQYMCDGVRNVAADDSGKMDCRQCSIDLVLSDDQHEHLVGVRSPQG